MISLSTKWQKCCQSGVCNSMDGSYCPVSSMNMDRRSIWHAYRVILWYLALESTVGWLTFNLSACSYGDVWFPSYGDVWFMIRNKSVGNYSSIFFWASITRIQGPTDSSSSSTSYSAILAYLRLSIWNIRDQYTKIYLKSSFFYSAKSKIRWLLVCCHFFLPVICYEVCQIVHILGKQILL